MARSLNCSTPPPRDSGGRPAETSRSTCLVSSPSLCGSRAPGTWLRPPVSQLMGSPQDPPLNEKRWSQLSAPISILLDFWFHHRWTRWQKVICSVKTTFPGKGWGFHPLHSSQLSCCYPVYDPLPNSPPVSLWPHFPPHPKPAGLQPHSHPSVLKTHVPVSALELLCSVFPLPGSRLPPHLLGRIPPFCHHLQKTPLGHPVIANPCSQLKLICFSIVLPSTSQKRRNLWEQELFLLCWLTTLSIHSPLPGTWCRIINTYFWMNERITN